MNTKIKINEVKNNQMNNALTIFELVKFIIKSALMSRMLIIVTLLLSIFALTIPVFMFPWTSTACFSFFIMVTIPLLVFLGWFSFSLKNSSLYENLTLGGMSKTKYYLGQYISLWIISMVLSILYLVLFNIIASFGILLYDYANFGDRMIVGSINKNYYAILNFLYIVNINSLLTFSIYFLFRNTVKTKNQYYSLIFTLIILTFIFGGILNGYFDSVMIIDSNGDRIIDENQWSVDPNESYKWYPEAARGLFPMEMFWPCLIFPYFSIGQMFTYGYALIGNEISSVFNNTYANLNESTFFMNLPENTFWNFSFKYNFEWIAVFVMPYIWIAVSVMVGLALGKGNK